jgi:hypothetical protein
MKLHNFKYLILTIYNKEFNKNVQSFKTNAAHLF